MIERTAFLCLFLLLVSTILTDAVDRSKFRKCQDTGFCRAFRPMSGPIYGDHYKLDKTSFSETEGRFSAKVLSPSGSSPLNLAVSFYGTGSVRVRLTENEPRWQPNDLLMDSGSHVTAFKRLSDAEKRGLAHIPALQNLSPDSYLALGFTSSAAGTATTAGQSLLVLHLSPLKVELYSPEGELQVTLNERALLHYEASAAPANEVHSAASGGEKVKEEDRHGGKTVVDYGEDGLAHYADGTKEVRAVHQSASQQASEAVQGDNFGGHRDTMPRGARSVGLDIAFPYAQHVYGIPEHATSLSLPTTAVGTAEVEPHYSEPYRLYNLDVFEYEIGNTMALYGNIPLLLAHGKTGKTGAQKSMTAGVFWFNPSETFVDISDGGTAAAPYKQSRWLSESGEVDVFLLPGPDAAAVYRQYTALTGTQQLPPLFALGYHQCRWNYRDERDVAAVESTFESLDYPVDVIWLDIEHTDGKRYFTWDKRMFPNPIEMQANLTRHGRKMVTIVDPHIKRDDHYPVHKEATAKGLYIKNKDGADFDGWCWPGSSSYLDFTSSEVRAWWAKQFGLDKYLGSSLDLFTWNDMNEPSVFNGPEVSMPKDATNLAGVEHREWHNLYGIYMQMATALGLTVRSPAGEPQQRPFVLTRSFWAGSQRYGAMWTGDNTATWPHLQIASPMLLSINLGGLSFAGADVGGFFGEPSAELFTRWYQAGAFTPFFRGHAHLDTKRREPWVFGEPYTSIARAAAMQRYSLLPLWYTIFYQAYATGLPVMRPMFLEFPEDTRTFAMDNQYMLGEVLLVAPVTAEGQSTVQVYLPTEGKNGAIYNFWYDLETLQAVPAAATPGALTSVSAPLSKIPVFIRPGSIVPRKLRLRRSSKLMHFDPYTLVVAPITVGKLKGTAEGKLYLDDERSLAHEVSGAYAYRAFNFADNTLTCTAATTATTTTTTTTSSTAISATGGVAAQGYDAPNTVERVVIAGQSRAPKQVLLRVAGQSDVELQFVFDSVAQTITIKKPDARVVDEWSIKLVF